MILGRFDLSSHPSSSESSHGESKSEGYKRLCEAFSDCFVCAATAYGVVAAMIAEFSMGEDNEDNEDNGAP